MSTLWSLAAGPARSHEMGERQYSKDIVSLPDEEGRRMLESWKQQVSNIHHELATQGKGEKQTRRVKHKVWSQAR